MKQTTDNTYSDKIPAPNQNWGLFGDIGVYGISIQGSSHVSRGTPCQDNNGFLYLEQEGVLIVAIADGVGSCSLSHWGAYIAVNAAISAIAEELRVLSEGHPLELAASSREQIEQLFHTAFCHARDKVSRVAQEQERLEALYQSTLTAAIYDGHSLACCHVGDDGIVAQGVSGNYRMITERIKGEEANSVVPLQSGRWQVTIISTEISGFLLSTDGVLDHFVSGKTLGNRVYYPFFERRIYGMMPRDDLPPDEAVQDIFERTRVYLQSDKFRQKVTDDITVLAVANQALLQTGVHPKFSREKWEKEGQRFWEEMQRKLYPGQYAAQTSTAVRKESPEKNQQDTVPPVRKRTVQDLGQPDSSQSSLRSKEDPKTLFDHFVDWVASRHCESDPAATESRRVSPREAEFHCRACDLRIIVNKKKISDMANIRCPCCGDRLQVNPHHRSSSK